MTPSTYKDMHLLNEVTQRPDATQRELSHRIGAALGLTNLMLRRLAKKGYIKITGTKRSRIRYLITPKGILEKSRLTYEFIQHSLQLYGRIRLFLREQLALVAARGHRRILLCGTGELAEIAFLTIHEMGLELIGVVDEQPIAPRFLGHAVQDLNHASLPACDCVIVASPRWDDGMAEQFKGLGIQAGRVIRLPMPGTPAVASPATAFVAEPVPLFPVPAPAAAGESAIESRLPLNP